jgi:adipocyte plasma membrane-associated protein
LIRYDLETGKIRILDEQLSFPNGLQLADDQQSILVCETSLARIIRHWIGGNSSIIGQSEVFVDNLPGLPDNIRLTSTGNYWIAFASVRHETHPSLIDRLRNWPRLRALLSVCTFNMIIIISH